MRLTKAQKRKFWTLRWIFLAAIILAPVYTILVDGFASWYPFLMAFLIAPSIVLIFAFFEFIAFDGRIRKLPFLVLLIIRVSAYLFSILFCVLSIVILVRMLRYGHTFQEEINSPAFQFYLEEGDFKVLVAYIFGLVILTNFTLQMNRKMGQGVLKGILLGKYHEPRETDVFIMFLKFRNADFFIRELGNRKFLELYNEVIYDITNTIIFNKGVISSYDDDEILIIWTREDGIENAHAVRLLSEIEDELDQYKVRYFEKYGGIPRFDAAVHFGKVVCGEIGKIKSEIRFHGDTINTAHRIFEIASGDGSFLISRSVYELINIPSIYESESIGLIQMRGKKEPLELFRIQLKSDLL